MGTIKLHHQDPLSEVETDLHINPRDAMRYEIDLGSKSGQSWFLDARVDPYPPNDAGSSGGVHRAILGWLAYPSLSCVWSRNVIFPRTHRGLGWLAYPIEIYLILHV